jgi:2-polyprenyl-3-methyl-5-hydroxy-6-metoxy-1,4-benzoquinol methylase
LLGLPGHFTVVECQRCGLRFTNPRPSINELGYYYPDNYGPFAAHPIKSDSQNETLWNKLKAGLKQSPFGPFLKKISDLVLDSETTLVPNLSEGAKVLELGCATGWFLSSLRKKGWDLYGVEPGKAAVDYAKQELGLNVFCGTLEKANFPSDYFDAIFAWHVIEHLSNPFETLREINRILKKDGYLEFSIPNAGCWEFYVFRDKWYGLDLPRHLFHFSLTSVKKMLEDGDFVVEKIFYQKNISNIVVSIGYCLEDLVGKNMISNYLRTFPQSNSPLLKPFSLSLATFLSVIRQGGRMTFVCRARKNKA